MLRHHTSSGHESRGGIGLKGTPFPWFDRESYPHVLEVMVDHDLLPSSYDRWLKQAQRVLILIRIASSPGAPTMDGRRMARRA
jgi:hypothetical protein